jgi:uncharacterized protein (UPF0333 family)
MKIKSQIIGALFLALVVILTLKPKIINNIYDNLLGRLFLICVIIFVSMNNVTLGLLVVLVIIIALNQFFEGFEPNGKSVIRAVNNNPNIISNLKEDKADGISSINLQDLRNTTMSKDSNTIQVDKNMNRSEEVDPSTSNMLNSNLKENFTLLGSNY